MRVAPTGGAPVRIADLPVRSTGRQLGRVSRVRGTATITATILCPQVVLAVLFCRGEVTGTLNNHRDPLLSVEWGRVLEGRCARHSWRRIPSRAGVRR